MAQEKSAKYPVKVKMTKLSAYADDGLHVAGQPSGTFYTTPGHAKELASTGYAEILEGGEKVALPEDDVQPELNPVDEVKTTKPLSEAEQAKIEKAKAKAAAAEKAAADKEAADKAAAAAGAPAAQ